MVSRQTDTGPKPRTTEQSVNRNREDGAVSDHLDKGYRDQALIIMIKPHIKFEHEKSFF